MSNLKDKQYMLVSAVGIFVCYFYFGIMQEKITRGRYGTEENEDGTVGQRFTYTLSLVAVQCMFNYLFVKGKYSKFLISDDEPRHLINIVLHFSYSYR